MAQIEIDARQPRREFQKRRAEILSHPLRVRILEIANELDVSAASFVRGGYARGLLDHLDDGVAVSQVSYHFRKLVKAGCVEIVQRRVGRGTVENVYRGAARASFSAEDWNALHPERRREISGVILQGLMARAESAVIEGTFDAREDRCLTWVQMALDEQGWRELTEVSRQAAAAVERVRAGSEERLGRAGKPVPTSPITWGMLAFESPSP